MKNIKQLLCLCFAFIFGLCVLFSGCVTPTGKSPGPSFKVAEEKPAAPKPPKREIDFVVQVMKAHKPHCFSPDGKYLLTTSNYPDTVMQLWDVPTGRLVRTYPPDTSNIKLVRFDPKGRYLMVVNDSDDIIRLVDFRSGLTVGLVDQEKAGAPVMYADFTRDGQFIVIYRSGRFPRLFDIKTGREVVIYKPNKRGGIHGCFLAPDGRRILLEVGQEALDNFRFEWFQVNTGQRIGSFKIDGMVPEFSLTNPTMSPEGRYVVRRLTSRNSHRALIEIIDLHTRRVRHVRYGMPTMDDFQFSNDGRYLFCQGIGEQVTMIELSSGKIVERLGEKHADGYAVSPADSTVACATKYSPNVRRIEIFNFENMEKVKQIAGISPAKKNDIGFLPGGLAYIDAISCNLNLKTGEVFNPVTPGATLFPSIFSGDRTRALMSSWTGSSMVYSLNEWPSRRMIKRMGGLPAYYPIMMNQDGKWLLMSEKGTSNDWAFYNLEIGKVTKILDYPELKGELSETLLMTMSPNGRLAADAFMDSRNSKCHIYLWDTQTGRRKDVFKTGDANLIRTIAFSPDSKLLAVSISSLKFIYEGGLFGTWLEHDHMRALTDNRVEVWNVDSGGRVRTIKNLISDVYAVTFSPDSGHLFIGSADGMVNAFEVKSGSPAKSFATPSQVSLIRISPDGTKMLVQGFALSYWDLQSGKRLYTTYTGENYPGRDPDYLTWTPDGYYRGSDRLAREYCHLVRGMETYPLDRFFEQFYNPAMIEARVRGLDVEGLDIAKVLDASPPPRVRISAPKVNPDGTAKVEVFARDTGGGVREVRFFHNGKRLGDGTWGAIKSFQLSADGKGIRDRGIKITSGVKFSAGDRAPTVKVKPPRRGDLDETFHVRLLSGENTFRATAFSNEMVESEPVEVTVPYKGEDIRPVLHIVAIGIHEYMPPISKLPMARADAEGFVRKMTRTAPALFSNYKVTTLYDARATRYEILKAMEKVAQRSTEADMVVFFFAGHGIVQDEDGRFYLVAHGVRDIDNPAGEKAISREGLSDLELGSALQKIPALKQVVFMDACQSGGADFSTMFRQAGREIAIKRIGRASGTWIFSAAGKDEAAYETKDLGHGLFTYSVLSGLEGGADSDASDGTIELSELESFVIKEVTNQARRLGIRQRPTIQRGLNDFPFSRLR